MGRLVYVREVSAIKHLSARKLFVLGRLHQKILVPSETDENVCNRIAKRNPDLPDQLLPAEATKVAHLEGATEVEVMAVVATELLRRVVDAKSS